MHGKLNDDWLVSIYLVEIASNIKYLYSIINRFVISKIFKSRFNWLISRILAKLKNQIHSKCTRKLIRRNCTDGTSTHTSAMTKNCFTNPWPEYWSTTNAPISIESVESWLLRSGSTIALRWYQAHRAWPATTAVMPNAKGPVFWTVLLVLLRGLQFCCDYGDRNAGAPFANLG